MSAKQPLPMQTSPKRRSASAVMGQRLTMMTAASCAIKPSAPRILVRYGYSPLKSAKSWFRTLLSKAYENTITSNPCSFEGSAAPRSAWSSAAGAGNWAKWVTRLSKVRVSLVTRRWLRLNESWPKSGRNERQKASLECSSASEYIADSIELVLKQGQISSITSSDSITQENADRWKCVSNII